MTQIDELRRWRTESINAHLYSTAELVSTKILAMSGHPDDAYWLAQSYYGMGEYLRGAELVLDGNYEQVSMKCRYIAVLCLIRAQELDRALEVVEAGINDSAGSTLGSTSLAPPPSTPAAGAAPSAKSASIIPPLIFPKPNGSHNTNNNYNPHHNNNNNNNAANNQKVRVVSTSSLRAPGGSGARTISGSSRISMILPDEEEEPHNGSYPQENDMENEELHNVFVRSLLQYLLGRIHTAQSRFVQAKAAYVAALRTDARCFEAYSQLIKYHAMTPSEEWQLLKSLDFSLIGADFGRSIYALRLSTTLHDEGLAEAIENLLFVYQIPETDSDVLLAQAEVCYEKGSYTHAKLIFEKILQHDPRNLRVYPTYASCLLELKEINSLYKISHELAMFAQDVPETWYVIGLYYLARGSAAEARQYFSKASLLDPGFASAWVAFAQTFAEEAEHEQAINAFSTAVRLFPGYNIPYISIGMQYLQLLNLPLALKYLEGAVSRFDEDPLVLNELGMVRYQMSELPESIATLNLALGVAEANGCDQSLLATIKSNMAFALRKYGRVQEALNVFNDIAHFTRLDANVLATTALCYMQLNQYHKATAKLAQALAINGNDPVANELMRRATQATADEFNIAAFAESNASLMSSDRRTIRFD